MFGRPRCREWTPLATQQLRLRSLIQVSKDKNLPCSQLIKYHVIFVGGLVIKTNAIINCLSN